jgi:hypothetical protein
MKSLKIFLISVTITSFPLYAQEKICFPKDTAVAMRKDLLRKDFLEAESKSLHKNLELSTKALAIRKEQLDISRADSDRLAERLRKTSDTSGLYNYLWFGLGVLATGVAVYGAGRLK